MNVARPDQAQTFGQYVLTEAVGREAASSGEVGLPVGLVVASSFVVGSTDDEDGQMVHHCNTAELRIHSLLDRGGSDKVVLEGGNIRYDRPFVMHPEGARAALHHVHAFVAIGVEGVIVHPIEARTVSLKRGEYYCVDFRSAGGCMKVVEQIGSSLPELFRERGSLSLRDPEEFILNGRTLSLDSQLGAAFRRATPAVEADLVGT